METSLLEVRLLKVTDLTNQINMLVTFSWAMLLFSLSPARLEHQEWLPILVPAFVNMEDEVNSSCSALVPLLFHTEREFNQWIDKSIYVPSDNLTDVCRFAYMTHLEMFKSAIKFGSDIFPRYSRLSWYCEIEQDFLCNGFSSCLTDECHCQDSSVFYCKDKSGCISLNQVS